MFGHTREGSGAPRVGVALLNDGVLNKGTAFTEAERRERGLEGLLPPTVEILDRQVNA